MTDCAVDGFFASAFSCVSSFFITLLIWILVLISDLIRRAIGRVFQHPTLRLALRLEVIDQSNSEKFENWDRMPTINIGFANLKNSRQQQFYRPGIAQNKRV